VIKDYLVLAKMRLSIFTSLSGLFGFALSQKEANFWQYLLMFFAGFLVSASAGTLNQVIEKETDALMNRTAARPIPAGRISKRNAYIYAFACLIVGLAIFIYRFNHNAALLSLLSWGLYVFAYTPLKKAGLIAVFVGAIPGAFPPMIGWLAGTNTYGWKPGILFAIQFIWQFPHFWAVAWIAHDDYKKAGFKLLPGNGEQDFKTAIQTMIYTLLLIPLSWMPYYLGMTGINSAFVATLASVLFLCQTLYLVAKTNRKAALQLMFGSFLYLPIVQIAYLFDKT
jgi:heme o synthase